MLPPIEIEDDGAGDSGLVEPSAQPDGSGGGSAAAAAPAGGETQPSRQQWRVREIALQRMIEATSIARVNRALRTRTTASGAGRFNIGDVVEIHRPADTQDVSGWAGPATITAVDPTHGRVTVRFRNGEMICRLQDVRTFIGAVFDGTGAGMSRAGMAWDIV